MTRLRKRFVMSDKQLKTILRACTPVGDPQVQKDNIEAAWRKLGKHMGFDHMTVKTLPDEGDNYFEADLRRP